MARRRILIMGAAGRDFHNFNVAYRDDPASEVVAFTATQIPGIANRRYPPELAGPLYPDGVPIFDESQLSTLIPTLDVDSVVFAYSDISHETVMHAASQVLAAGADFELLGPRRTMLKSARPVVAICATRTGAGKSQTSRHVTDLLAAAGLRAVVVRHPMPYGDLARQAVERFETFADLDTWNTTIEEREEYEPHIEAGHIVYAGVDYGRILAKAEEEADVIVWDGGNNDLPFYRPNLLFVVADPLRPADGTRYHPGETNLRMADVVVINKVDSADPDEVAALRSSISVVNPDAEIVTADSELSLAADIAGKRVVIVEDGPTLTHGGMPFGAGVTAARRFGAAQLVDPRPFAVGSIATVLARYPALEPLVPAMGYSAAQIAELEETLNAVDADLVLTGTPIDLTRVLRLNKPVVRVRYDLVQLGGTPMVQLLEPIIAAARSAVGQPVLA
jgi:predicted GTPase